MVTAEGAPALGAETSKGRVLLVDDDRTICTAYARGLEAFGYQVVTANNGAEAIERMARSEFEVILSDITMPGMDGLSFLRAVRQRDLDVPVLLMTGGPSLESAVRAVEYGAFRYLYKPVELSSLLEMVSRAIALHALARTRRMAFEALNQTSRPGDRAAKEVRFANALDTLWLGYQPIVGWPERRVIGYEALARSEEASLLKPSVLFETAEQLGKLFELGRTVRRCAAKAVAELPPGVRLFVNLHPGDLLDPELFDMHAPLTQHAPRVVLEITERISLDHIADLEQRVAQLREAGYCIALDDLGTGYAGLGALARLEPEIVKIDMYLVQELHFHRVKQGVVEAILKLARQLHMEVIAEGVEVPEDRDALERLGCQWYQGYLFGRPGKKMGE